MQGMLNYKSHPPQHNKEMSHVYAARKREYKELAQAFATERAQNFAALLFEQGDKFFVIFLVFARGARGEYKRILRCGGELFDELYKFRVVAARIYSAAEPDGVVL